MNAVNLLCLLLLGSSRLRSVKPLSIRGLVPMVTRNLSGQIIDGVDESDSVREMDRASESDGSVSSEAVSDGDDPDEVNLEGLVDVLARYAAVVELADAFANSAVVDHLD